MFYPILIIGATFILGISMALFVMPKVTKLFKAFEVELPLSTRVLLWVANILEHYGLIAVSSFVGITVFLIWLLRKKFFKPYFHRFFLVIPIFGRIIQNMNLARFSRILASLLKSPFFLNHNLFLIA